MNQNKLSEALIKTKTVQPTGLKTERLIDKKLKALNKFERVHGKSDGTLLERGKIYLEKNSPEMALKYLKQSLEIKKNLETIHKLSICYGKLDQNDEASQLFEDHLQDFKWSGAFWCLLAYYKKKVGDNHAAHSAAYTAIAKFDQVAPAVWRILHNAGLDIERHQEGYELSKKYINKNRNLDEIIVETFIGNCLHIGGEQAKEAVHFLETTAFNWKKDAILCGLAAQLYLSASNDIKTSLKLNKLANKLNPENINLIWNLSLNQLRTGELEDGLRNYEVRFSWPDFPSPRRIFKKPRFHPGVAKNSKIMLWYEQGIGDQLRFLSALPKFQQEFPNLRLEPSRKTEILLNNSFPHLPTQIDNFHPEELYAYDEDFDYHLPFGSMFIHVIGEYGEKVLKPDFSILDGYLKPEKLRAHFWREKLSKLSSKPKVGFCWRSGLVNKKRNQGYTDLKHWEQLFKNDEFSFVNLQYDLDHQELIERHPEAQEYFLNTGFLDQRDDLEGAQALISNLDFVISPASTPGMMASASGIPTIIYHPPNIWSFGRVGEFVKNPIFHNTKSYHTYNVRDNQKLISDITDYLKGYF
jgi:ADP-heptose:LPS heptosyltransferase